MLSLASKLFFAIAAVVLCVGVGYGVAVGEQSGVVLLLLVAAGALVVAAVLIGVPDLAPVGDTAPAPVPVLDPARPSRWPILTAVGAVMLAAAAATGTLLFVVGLLAVLGAVAAWFGQAWSEHPSWTELHAARVTDRALLPVFLPVGVFALVAVIVLSFSRVLLAVPKEASTGIALVMAVLILAACSLVATRPGLGSSALTALAIVAGVAVVGAGVAGAVHGERTFHEEGGAEAAAKADQASDQEKTAAQPAADASNRQAGAASTTIPPAAGAAVATTQLMAKNLKYDKDRITLRAGAGDVIAFENADTSIPHNVAVLQGGKSVFAGDILTGPAKKSYTLPKLTPGTYEFRCDVHPTTMKGELVVQ